jgi:trimethylamine--corrinoid protein Co-methyltransferase
MFDMRCATTPMGAIETMMIDMAFAQVGKHLGLPVHAYMGLSDSKKVDAQAGLESATGAVLAVLAGVNMISGPGMMDFENCQSLEKLVIDHEVCGMALRLAAGITQRDEPIATSLLANLSADADFLSHPHTKKWYRRETYYPGPVIDRMTDEASLADGGRCACERAHKIVQEKLAAYQPVPLDDDVARELEVIMSRRLKTFGVKLADHLPADG